MYYNIVILLVSTFATCLSTSMFVSTLIVFLINGVLITEYIFNDLVSCDSFECGLYACMACFSDSDDIKLAFMLLIIFETELWFLFIFMFVNKNVISMLFICFTYCLYSCVDCLFVWIK